MKEPLFGIHKRRLELVRLDWFPLREIIAAAAAVSSWRVGRSIPVSFRISVAVFQEPSFLVQS